MLNTNIRHTRTHTNTHIEQPEPHAARECGMASHEPWRRRSLSSGLLVLLVLLILAAHHHGANASTIIASTAATPSAPLLPPTIATAAAAPSATTAATPPSVRPMLAPPNQHRDSAALSSRDDDDDGKIRESVVISTAADAEREAQDLYDKALKQYDSYGATARNICATWELRGCQCSLAMDELHLSCRNVGLEVVPLDLPVDIVKL